MERGTVNNSDRPIGYWLLHLHGLIERQFEAALADLGLERRHWQTVNMLSRSPLTRAEAERALAPFWADGVPDLDAILRGPGGLVDRGWVSCSADTLALTEQGRIVHATTASRVDGLRAQLLQGLTQEQYTETVRILSVMAGNLEPAAA